MKVAGVGRLDCRVNQTIAAGNLSQGNSPQVLVCQPGSQWVIWHLNGGARVDGEEACHRCIGEIGPAGSRGLEQVCCECGGAPAGVGEVGLTSVLPCPQRRSRPALLAWVTAKTHRGESPSSPRGTYPISLILPLQEKVDVEGGSLMMKYLI